MKLLHYYWTISSLSTIAMLANNLNVITQISVVQATNQIIKIFENLNWKFATKNFANITVNSWKNNDNKSFTSKVHELFIEAIITKEKNLTKVKELIMNAKFYIRKESNMFGPDFIIFNLYKNFRTQSCYGTFIVYDFLQEK